MNRVPCRYLVVSHSMYYCAAAICLVGALPTTGRAQAGTPAPAVSSSPAPSNSNGTSSNNLLFDLAGGALVNLGQGKSSTKDYFNLSYNGSTLFSSGQAFTLDNATDQLSTSGVALPASGVPNVTFNNGTLSGSGGLLGTQFSKVISAHSALEGTADVQATDKGIVTDIGLEHPVGLVNWLNKAILHNRAVIGSDLFLLYESDNGSATAAATSGSANSTASKGYGVYGYSTSISDVIFSKKTEVTDASEKLALAKRVVEETIAKAGTTAESYEDRLKKAPTDSRTRSLGTLNLTTEQAVDAFFSNTANATRITSASTTEPILTFAFASSGWYQYTGSDPYARFSNLLSTGFTVYPKPGNTNLTIQLTYEAGTVRADPGTYNHFVALTGGYKF